MSDLNDKLIETITKLIQLTQENKLKWRSEKSPTTLGREGQDIVETIFLARDKNRNLRLYSKSYKVTISSIYGAFFQGDDKEKWRTDVALEILDEAMNPIWEFPPLPPLSDLLAAVQYQVAEIDDFIEDILGR